jgi:hypothetical protein
MVAESEITYSICTLVTSETEYADMKRSFESAGFSEPATEYLYADNIKSNSLDAYEAYRRFSRIAKGKYILFCHQDVLALDSVNVLANKIQELDKLDPLWAIAGNAGAASIRSVYKFFVNNDDEKEIVGDLPAKVHSLDENFLLIRRESGLSTSADLSGFHFYATDLCINADILGYRCYVIAYLVKHRSWGNKNEAFWAARDLFIHKYMRALRFRIIQTTCARFVISGDGLFCRIANVAFVMFFFKEFDKFRKRFSQKS